MVAGVRGAGTRWGRILNLPLPWRSVFAVLCPLAALESKHEAFPNQPLLFQITKRRRSKSKTFGSPDPDFTPDSSGILKSSKARHTNGPCFRLSLSRLSCLEPFLQHWNLKLWNLAFFRHTKALELSSFLHTHTHAHTHLPKPVSSLKCTLKSSYFQNWV